VAKSKPPRLLTEERRRKILEVVDETAASPLQTLVTRLARLLRRHRSRAISTRSPARAALCDPRRAVRRLEPARDYPVDFKATLHRAEKQRIGEAAAGLVQPNERPSSVGKRRHHRRSRASPQAPQTHNVTVITNALNIATELCDAPGISLIMIGGILRRISRSFVGPQAEKILRELHADRLFLAVDGFDLDNGPSTPDILEAQLNGLMNRCGEGNHHRRDSSQAGRRSLSRIGSIDRVKRLITDVRAPEDLVSALRKRNVEVVTV